MRISSTPALILDPARPLRALLAASIAVPVALFAVGAWQSHKQLHRQAERKVQHQAFVLGEHADKVLGSLQLVVEQANQRVQGLSWDEIRTSKTLWEDLKRLARSVEQVDAIFAIDPQGTNALTTRAFPPPPVDFSDRDYFVAQRSTRAGAYLSGSYTGKISGHTIFNVSMRRETARGAFDGVVGVSAFVDYFETFYRTVAVPEDDAAVTLMRDDGQVLARYPSPKPSDVAITPEALLQRFGRAGEGLFYAPSDRNGAPRLIAFRKLKDYPAYVSVGIDTRTVLATWRETLVQWGLLAALAAASLFFTTWLALRRTRREAVAVQRWQETYENLTREVERREHAEAALLQTRKLEALGQLTGGVAHDFNNLLQILGGNLERMEAHATDERTRHAIRASQRTVERGEKLVQQLLAFARRQPLSFEVFDLNDRLRGMDDLLRQVATGIVIEIAPAEDLWPVEADATQLDLAIINLVVNARDALPRGGTVRIETANKTLRDGDHAEIVGDFVAVTVSDDGDGMPPDIMERVWEPFFTTKAAGKGTGLGLSMVYGFAKQSGGGAVIRSEVGEGTSVTLFLRKGTPTRRRPPVRVIRRWSRSRSGERKRVEGNVVRATRRPPCSAASVSESSACSGSGRSFHSYFADRTRMIASRTEFGRLTPPAGRD
jgi:two-component system, NtrC family, sensor kinase